MVALFEPLSQYPVLCHELWFSLCVFCPTLHYYTNSRCQISFGWYLQDVL